MPDENGAVWAGELQRRIPPAESRYGSVDRTRNGGIAYGMPERYAHDRRTWIGNSTDPISVRNVDYQGYVARIQPLDQAASGLRHGGRQGLACRPPLPDLLLTCRAPRCSRDGSRCRPTTRCGSGWSDRFQSV